MSLNRITPLYEQLTNELKSAILNGKYSDGLFPSERELATEYNVSRTVVNTAITHLEKDGLLMRNSKQGTFLSSYATKSIQHSKPVIYVSFGIGRWESLQSSNMYAKIVGRFREKATEAGYHIILQPHCDGEPWQLKTLLSNPMLKGILTFYHPRAKELRKLISKSIPIVSLDHCIELKENEPLMDDVFYVTCDNIQGGKLLGEYLIKQGHKRIAISGILSNKNYPTVVDRIRGIEESGLEIDPNSYFDCKNQEKLKKSIKDKTTAFITFSDNNAVITINSLLNMGVKIPKNVSLVSFDGLQSLVWEIEPRITTATMPCIEMANTAWGIFSGKLPPLQITLCKYSLTERESVNVIKEE